jgi:hypothetical protein
MIAIDILRDDNDDVLIENGDFVIGASDYVHIKDILIANPGIIKESPIVGLNAKSWLNKRIDGYELQKIRQNLTLALRQDGYVNINIVDLPSMVIKADRLK